MGRRHIFTLAVVLLVVAAGCAGNGDDAGQTTTTEAMDTTMGDGMDGDGMDGDGMDGDGMDGEDGDGSMMGLDDVTMSGAESALREAGSFTATWTFSGTDEDGTASEVGYTYYADVDADRAHVVFSAMEDDQMADAGWERYSTDGTTYTYFGSEAGAFYQVTQEDLDVIEDSVAWAGIYAHRDMSGLSFQGTEQFDGEPVRRYRLTDQQMMFWTAGAAAQTGENPEVEITDFEYVVLIDENGLSRHESWSYTGTTSDGDQVRASWEYSLTDVGSTTVEEPEWVEEARAQG